MRWRDVRAWRSLQTVLGLWAAALIAQTSPVFFGSGPAFGSMKILFWLVVIAASGCVITSMGLFMLGWKRRIPELGIVGGFFLVGSLLPLVHGITTPGVLYGENKATMASVFVTIPLAVLVGAPTLWGRTALGRRLLMVWRQWVLGWVTVTLLLCGIFLVRPNLIPFPPPGSLLSGAVSVLMIVATGALAVRHLRLAIVAHDIRYAAVALGFGWFGASAAVWFDGAPLTVGFWSAHLFDIFGVFAATIGGFIVHRKGGSVDDVLSPIVSSDPLSALEAGLDPTVHRFVASLEAKDQITRDHVIRTSAMAIATAERLGLPASELRRVGLGALLHDVGKLDIPDEIINKNGKLDDDEYAIIKTHTTIGARMVEQSSVIDDIAPLIESHHERIDGNGYPNRLEGDEIPFEATIISVCDAFDAIAHTRQYRSGAGWEKALDVLAEHAGTQWHPDVVRAVTELTREDNGPIGADVLDRIGRCEQPDDGEAVLPACGCGDALPEVVAHELESV